VPKDFLLALTDRDGQDRISDASAYAATRLRFQLANQGIDTRTLQAYLGHRKYCPLHRTVTDEVQKFVARLGKAWPLLWQMSRKSPARLIWTSLKADKLFPERPV
jgi:hypothetical protein